MVKKYGAWSLGIWVAAAFCVFALVYLKTGDADQALKIAKQVFTLGMVGM
jgi:predicted outer membrane lipoprotein